MLALDCLKFHTLPRAGGWFDQPMMLTRRMRLALYVYEVVNAYRSASSMSPKAFGDWQSRNAQLMQFLIKYVWKMDSNG